MVEIAVPENAPSLRERIRNRVAEGIDLNREVNDEEIALLIDRCILEETRNMYLPLKEKVQIRTDIFNGFRRLDVLTEFLEDESVTEIMVNGMDEIFVERDGKLQLSGKRFLSEEKLMSVVQRLAGDCNRRVNEASPILDVRLKDGSRGNIVIPPVSLGGTAITIRKFPKKNIGMKELIEYKTLDLDVAAFLGLLVRARYNILISGGTGSGKTTFLNALANNIEENERIVTIEDSAELQLVGVRNLVRMEGRQANMEGENEVTIRQLIRTSLRMRPDRIIVGEVRGEEAIDMLQAMNTGHDGSLSTGHANSAEDMLTRLETMVLQGVDMPLLAIKQQIASAVDIVIHLGRMRDGSRKVKKICEVKGMKAEEIELNTLYEYVEMGMEQGKILGGLKKMNQLIHIDKLMDSGNFENYKKLALEVETV